MGYVLGKRSLQKLSTVDDRLQRIVYYAIAGHEKISLRWGAAWHINSIGEWPQSSEEAMNAYIDLRRSQGRRPFIDAPHFELIV